MKQGFIKYSDERNKRFSIKTEILSGEGEKKVYKEAVFPEGNAHVERMFLAQDKLRKFYPNVEVCHAERKNQGIVFDYIEGELLLNKYAQAVKNNDKAAYEKLLKAHRDWVCGDVSNQCEFVISAKFEQCFGSPEAYVGQKGLVFANFDAIAGNIILQNEKPVFIDYEWTCDFCMPEDLVVYHCIYDGYLHHGEFENFYPMDQVLELLDIKTSREILDASYHHFFDYVICDENGKSYAKDKYQCLKISETLDQILKEWEYCANQWQAAVKSNGEKDEEIARIREEWEKCDKERKMEIERLTKLQEEYHLLEEEHQRVAALYTEIINSKSWKMINKVRHPFG